MATHNLPDRPSDTHGTQRPIPNLDPTSVQNSQSYHRPPPSPRRATLPPIGPVTIRQLITMWIRSSCWNCLFQHIRTNAEDLHVLKAEQTSSRGLAWHLSGFNAPLFQHLGSLKRDLMGQRKRGLAGTPTTRSNDWPIHRLRHLAQKRVCSNP